MSAQVDEMQRHAGAIPHAGHGQAINRVAEQPVKLDRNDRGNALRPDQLEHGLPTGARCERFSCRDAGVNDDLDQLKPAKLCIGANRCDLRLEGDTLSRLFFG